MARLQAADPAASYATLKGTQYSGANEDCELANNDFATGDFRVLPATASTPGNGVPWFVSNLTVIDHFSEFYLTNSSQPLPVELLIFSAEAQGTAVQLTWRTASEKNSARFEVERGQNGREFTKIGEQAAQGNKASASNYTFLDEKPRTSPTHQATYYRLRQVDLDGTASYSPVRAVRFTQSIKTSLTAFPVPARAGQLLTVPGLPAGREVELLDALGRRVATAPATADGSARLTLPTSLAAGMYLLRTGPLTRQLSVTE